MAIRRFGAVCEPTDQAAVNAALADVSGNFENLFRIESLFEGDPDPTTNPDGSLDYSGTTIRKYSTGIVLVDDRQIAALKEAVVPPLSSADWRQINDRGPRFPDEYDLFLADYNLRRAFSFVHATGLLRCNNIEPSQTIGTTAVLVEQWDQLQQARATQFDGSGHRIEVEHAGQYDIEARVAWDDSAGKSLNFQLNLDAAPLGPVISRTSSPLEGIFPAETFAANGKLGLGVWADEADVTFDMRNSWLGIKRVS